MLHDLAEKIADAETVQAYNQAVKELANCLCDAGKPDKAQKLTEIASLRINRFSKRESKEDFAAGKAAVVEYCRLLLTETERTEAGLIAQVLKNFHLFCRNLYKTGMHDKCSNGIKEHRWKIREDVYLYTYGYLIAALQSNLYIDELIFHGCYFSTSSNSIQFFPGIIAVCVPLNCNSARWVRFEPTPSASGVRQPFQYLRFDFLETSLTWGG